MYFSNLVEHINELFGQQTESKPHGAFSEYCSTAYSSDQVALAIVGDTYNDLNISSKTVEALINSKGIYQRQPCPTHYHTVRFQFQRRIYTNREVDMAAL